MKLFKMTFQGVASRTKPTRDVTRKYFAIGFIITVTSFIITPFLAIYFTDNFHLSTPLATSLIGWSGVFNYAWSVIAGRMTDRFESAWPAKIGLFLACALQVGLLLQATAIWMFVALILSGLGRAFFANTITNGIYRSLPNEAANEVNSWFQTGVNASAFLCPFVVAVVGLSHFREIAYLALVLDVIVAVVFALRFRIPVYSEMTKSTEKERKTDSRAMLYVLLMIGALYAFAYKQYFTTLSLIFSRNTLFGFSLYPILVALEGIGAVVMQPVYIRCARILPLRFLLLLGAISYSLGFATLLAFGSAAVSSVAFALLFTAGSVLIGSTLSTMIFSEAPKGTTGTWLGLLNATRMASGLGIVLGGTALAHGGPTSLLLQILAAAGSLVFLAGCVCVHHALQGKIVERLFDA